MTQVGVGVLRVDLAEGSVAGRSSTADRTWTSDADRRAVGRKDPGAKVIGAR